MDHQTQEQGPQQTSRPTTGRRALVVGLGIAGMSAAIGLRQAGWSPVIIERARERRTGGYFIGLFPEGRQAAIDLGVMEHLHTRNPDSSATNWDIDNRGRRSAGLGFLDQPGGPDAVMRSDIEAALWHSVQDRDLGRIEVRFGTTAVHIEDHSSGATVLLTTSGTEVPYREDFDLIVGADGMRSSTRELVFGPHQDYLQSWNSIICAFELDQQAPTYGPQDGLIDARSKRAMWLFGFSDRAPTVLMTYRTKDVDAQFTRPRIDTLREVYAGMDHPAITHALDTLQQSPTYLFDSVHQVKMSTWHRGHVVLLGDAAWCLNLYSGMGATSAMRGGALLGEVLTSHPGDLEAALRSWETQLRPFITKHQRLARIKHQFFVPSGPIAKTIRNGLLNVITRRAERKTRTHTGSVQPAAARDDFHAGRH